MIVYYRIQLDTELQKKIFHKIIENDASVQINKDGDILDENGEDTKYEFETKSEINAFLEGVSIARTDDDDDLKQRDLHLFYEQDGHWKIWDSLDNLG